MKNKYFTLDSYCLLLRSALDAGYEFIPFRHDRLNGQRKCLLRHDIDADLEAALVLAHAEKSIGVCSTYFLMLRSPLYNLFSRRSHEIILEILSLGHDIALHYDHGFSPYNQGLVLDSTLIDREASILEDMFEQPIHAISFHQPGPEIIKNEINTGPRINTYSKQTLKDFVYFSDSNRNFKLGHKYADAFNDLAGKSLQLLIHPIWWVYDDISTEKVWDKAILCNLEQMQSQLLKTERAYGDRREFIIDYKERNDD